MTDLLQQVINEIKTPEDYRSACILVRHRINAGLEVDSGMILSLAAKGHLIQNTAVSQEFMATLGTEPETMDLNNSE